DELAALLGRDAPAFGEPGLQAVLLQHTADGLVRDAVNVAQLHCLARRQSQGPTPSADGRWRAGKRDQVGLLVPVELASILTTRRAVAERVLQSRLGEPLADALHRRPTHIQRGGDSPVGPSGAMRTLVGLEQDAGM